jgi:hypothetical protein
MTAAATLRDSTRVDWRGLAWAYLFFWYFSGVTHVLLQLSGTTGSYGLRQATIASILWLIPLLLFPQRARPIAAGIGLVLWAFSLASLGYYCIYGQEFSQSVIFIMFESNPAEASEYFAQYFAWWMVPALLIYSTVAWLLWRRVRPRSPLAPCGMDQRAIDRLFPVCLSADQEPSPRRPLRSPGGGNHSDAHGTGSALADGGRLPAVPGATCGHAGITR